MRAKGNAVAAVLITLGGLASAAGARGAEPAASQVDPFVARPRVIVMTDIANEPDDQMSMVRFLLYSNGFDVEGLVATTSTWMKKTVRPDVIHSVLDAYEKVQPNLLAHAPGYPTAAALRAVVVPGQPAYGLAAVGAGKTSRGAELILQAAQKADARPLWILGWGGTNTLAQALLDARATRTPAEVEAIVAKLRVYTISDQDDAGPWLRREFPALHYVAMPSTQDGEEYYLATWTGISGDRFYRNAPGADFTTFTDEWVNANIRSKEPLGKLYPFPCCIHEGDTPSFLGLIDNGLASAMSPAYGGWGGRYVWRRPSGESRPFWTQGGDSYPGQDSSRDTVAGVDGQTYTSDPATIWRWRTAFQNDFAARMDWTTRDARHANHNPKVVVNGRAGTEPLVLEAQVGTPLTLDAAGTSDPDGDVLKFEWLFYPEAGSGIPGQPVLIRRRPPAAAAGAAGIPSAPAGGPPALPPRVVIENATLSRATVVPKVEGIAHLILAVEDGGSPHLTSYRRVILKMKAAVAEAPPTAAYRAEDLGRTVRLTDTRRDVVVSIAPSRGNVAFDMRVKGQAVLHFPVASLDDPRAGRFGIPFLGPWANRLDEQAFYANGRRYAFDMELGNVTGAIPIHGFLANAEWKVIEARADGESAWVTSRLEFFRNPAWMKQFPFAHTLDITHRLHDGALEVHTRIENLGLEPMPVSIGFHPYFSLTDSPRDEWTIGVGARTQWLLAENKVPTGETRPIERLFPDPRAAALKDYRLDDVFTDLVRDAQGRAVMSMKGRSQRLDVELGPNYRAVVIFAPGPDRPFVCFEPMAGITNAMNAAHKGLYKELQTIPAGGTWEESFWVRPSGF